MLEFKPITKEICKLPSFFSAVLFKKIDVDGTGVITRYMFLSFWVWRWFIYFVDTHPKSEVPNSKCNPISIILKFESEIQSIILQFKQKSQKIVFRFWFLFSPNYATWIALGVCYIWNEYLSGRKRAHEMKPNVSESHAMCLRHFWIDVKYFWSAWGVSWNAICFAWLQGCLCWLLDTREHVDKRYSNSNVHNLEAAGP